MPFGANGISAARSTSSIVMFFQGAGARGPTRATTWPQQDAHIFATFVKVQIAQLQAIAKRAALRQLVERIDFDPPHEKARCITASGWMAPGSSYRPAYAIACLFR